MAGNLKIRALGNWSLGITAVLAILCIAMSILGFQKYEVLQSSTRDYIACEAAAQRFQTGSDTLTRQVRPPPPASRPISTPILRRPTSPAAARPRWRTCPPSTAARTR